MKHDLANIPKKVYNVKKYIYKLFTFVLFINL